MGGGGEGGTAGPHLSVLVAAAVGVYVCVCVCGGGGGGGQRGLIYLCL